jgi:hypothetical protein
VPELEEREKLGATTHLKVLADYIEVLRGFNLWENFSLGALVHDELWKY